VVAVSLTVMSCHPLHVHTFPPHACGLPLRPEDLSSSGLAGRPAWKNGLCELLRSLEIQVLFSKSRVTPLEDCRRIRDVGMCV